MSKRSKKIDRVVSLAEAEERRYGQMTGQAQVQLNKQLERLGELNAHRQDYVTKSGDIANAHSAHWKDYQNFLYRLDEAVRSQQSIVSDCEQLLESHRRRWMVKRQRVESLNRVLERYKQEEHALSERREQKAQDELPGKRGLYKD